MVLCKYFVVLGMNVGRCGYVVMGVVKEFGAVVGGGRPLECFGGKVNVCGFAV